MKTKRLDFELLRILAIFMVVFNHTQSRGYELFLVEGCQGINYALSILLSVLCKMGVPLFFMISGGLLLHREESLKKVIFGRFIRIAAALVLFSGILYFFWFRWGYLDHFYLSSFLYTFYHFGISQPYWFLYAYAALMLALPLLRVLAQNMRDSSYIYLTFLFLGYHMILAPLGTPLGWGEPNPDFEIPLISGVVYYFLMGYFFAHRFHWESLKWKSVGIMAVVSLIPVLIGCLLLHFDPMPSATGDVYREGFVVLPVFTVYLAVCKFVKEHPITGVMEKAISTLGGLVFGVYLMEGILRGELGFIFEYLEPRIHVLPACFVWVAAVVIAGFAITFILKKIPVIRKLF